MNRASRRQIIIVDSYYPSTATRTLETLKIGACVTMLGPDKEKGFCHVKEEDGQAGWVWSKNIVVLGSPSTAVAFSFGSQTD